MGQPTSVTPAVALDLTAAHRPAPMYHPIVISSSFDPGVLSWLLGRTRLGSFADANASKRACTPKGATASTKREEGIEDLSEMGSG